MFFPKEELMKALGYPFTNEVVARLRHLACISPEILESLNHEALSENWGNNNYVLEKYLAVHVASSKIATTLSDKF